jgi:hypothetical protein
MLMPSMCVELIGTLVTCVLLVADWYIWTPRYRISDPCGPEFDRRLVTDGEHNLSSQHGAESEFVPLLGSERAGQDLAAHP